MWPCALLHFSHSFREALVAMGLASFRPGTDELVQHFTICVYQAQEEKMRAWPAWRLGARRLIFNASSAMDVQAAPERHALIGVPPQLRGLTNDEEPQKTKRNGRHVPASSTGATTPSATRGKSDTQCINSCQFFQNFCVQECWEGECAPRVRCPEVPRNPPYGPRPSPGTERPPLVDDDQSDEDELPPIPPSSRL